MVEDDCVDVAPFRARQTVARGPSLGGYSVRPERRRRLCRRLSRVFLPARELPFGEPCDDDLVVFRRFGPRR